MVFGSCRRGRIERQEEFKVAILLTVAGAEAQEVFRTFTYEPAKAAVGNQPAVPAKTAEQFNTVVRKFTEFCVQRKTSFTSDTCFTPEDKVKVRR